MVGYGNDKSYSNVVTYRYQIVTMYVVVCTVPLALIYIWHRRRDIL